MAGPPPDPSRTQWATIVAVAIAVGVINGGFDLVTSTAWAVGTIIGLYGVADVIKQQRYIAKHGRQPVPEDALSIHQWFKLLAVLSAGAVAGVGVIALFAG